MEVEEMNQIILCNKCKGAKNESELCSTCLFYIKHYCNNCHEKSEETCNICKEARTFLERDDKRQDSRERTDRNHIIHISLEYAESNKLLTNTSKDILDNVIGIDENKKILKAFGCLTKTQKRRFIAYHIDGLTLDEIARKEGINLKNIHKSIKQSEKKLKNFLREG